mmetsp:Transcript_16795/g.19441  ORF Transcript_16795/g.19441 Transcript_16795/m.19441 type:complete len:124 (-) Transcript_16795:43-414(-)
MADTSSLLKIESITLHRTLESKGFKYVKFSDAKCFHQSVPMSSLFNIAYRICSKRYQYNLKALVKKEKLKNKMKQAEAFVQPEGISIEMFSIDGVEFYFPMTNVTQFCLTPYPPPAKLKLKED